MCIVGGLLSEITANAVSTASTSHPYQEIAARNVFHLKSASEPETTADPVPPPPRITLQGIVFAFDRKQVLFKSMITLRAGDAPKEVALILNEGESYAEITVLEIDGLAGTVRFDNRGQTQLLSLERDSVRWTGAVPMPLTTPNPIEHKPRPSASPSFSNEEQAVLIEINRERNKKLIEAGAMPPLPPTELTR